jgi:hypothetical protein
MGHVIELLNALCGKGWGSNRKCAIVFLPVTSPHLLIDWLLACSMVWPNEP